MLAAYYVPPIGTRNASKAVISKQPDNQMLQHLSILIANVIAFCFRLDGTSIQAQAI